MDPENPIDAHAIARAYMAVLEQHYRESDPFPMPHSALPFPKPVIQRSIRTVLAALAQAGSLTPELVDTLEVAYTSLADYVDDELVRVMREYHGALADLDADTRRGPEKTSTAAWGVVADTSSLVGRIARAIADDTTALRAEFREFRSHTAGAAASTH